MWVAGDPAGADGDGGDTEAERDIGIGRVTIEDCPDTERACDFDGGRDERGIGRDLAGGARADQPDIGDEWTTGGGAKTVFGGDRPVDGVEQELFEPVELGF